MEAVQLLLQIPETLVNAQDNFLWTPIHEACHEGHLEVVRLLLRHRPSPAAAAAAEALGRSEVEKKAGVDLGAKSKEETTPLHDAVLSGRLEVGESIGVSSSDLHRLNIRYYSLSLTHA